ncbi:MAG: hypothetical protein M1814_002581 [Vezdaea aestivalis]|nr:MAG: hypothetical protein M1814_002581 [Vezdaea aestivalis]
MPSVTDTIRLAIEREKESFRQQYGNLDQDIYETALNRHLDKFTTDQVARITKEFRCGFDASAQPVPATKSLSAGLLDHHTYLPPVMTPSPSIMSVPTPAPSMMPTESRASEYSTALPPFDCSATSPMLSSTNPFEKQAWSGQPAGSYQPITLQTSNIIPLNPNRQRTFVQADQLNPPQYNQWLQENGTGDESVSLPTVQIDHSPVQRPTRRPRMDPGRLSLSNHHTMQPSFSYQSTASLISPTLSTPGTSAMQSEMSHTSSQLGGIGLMKLSSHGTHPQTGDEFSPLGNPTTFFSTGSFEHMGGATDLQMSDASNFTCVDPLRTPPSPLNGTRKGTTIGDLVQGAQDMKRTASNSSNASERSNLRLKEVIEKGNKTKIAPRATVTKRVQKTTPAKRRAGARRKDFRSIKRNQPLLCDKCDNKTFRGSHELARHQSREHNVIRETWTCYDGSAEALAAGAEAPKIPLKDCKHCREFKQYNVYYNAASHLRRAHFNPTEKGTHPANRAQQIRAGYNGGNKPDMTVLLRYYMRKQLKRDHGDKAHPDNIDQEATVKDADEDVDADADNDVDEDMETSQAFAPNKAAFDQNQLTTDSTRAGTQLGSVNMAPSAAPNSPFPPFESAILWSPPPDFSMLGPLDVTSNGLQPFDASFQASFASLT